MKTDSYTKVILTVIAVALSVIAFQNVDLFTKANASSDGFHTDKPAATGFVSVPVNPDGSINVNFPETMKVNIAEIGGSSVYGALPINLKELSGSSINTSNGIPVNIEAVDGSSVYGAIPTKEKN